MKNLEELKKEVALAIVNYYSNSYTREALKQKFKAENGLFIIQEEVLNTFIEIEKTKGYNITDFNIVEFEKSTMYNFFKIRNSISKREKNIQCEFIHSEDMKKKDVVKMIEYVNNQIVKEQLRNRYLLEKKEAINFIKEGKFFEHNLEKMGIDKETYNFLLNVKTNIEKDEKIENLEREMILLRNRIAELEGIND